MKIYAQKGSRLNDDDRLEIARLLIKAGYTVRIGREKKDGQGVYLNFVEYLGKGGQNSEEA